jgi:ABC-type antimicrobial peptide transport system permease subunit
MIWPKLIFGGFGRRGYEAIVAALVLVIATAVVASSLMVVVGASDALLRAAQNDRPDVVQVKSRFNRALFETPRSGYLPPLTLPVYEPLIDPEILAKAADGATTVIARQSFLRNVVSADAFLNVYIFGVDPPAELLVSGFPLASGRLLRSDDDAVAIVDQASASALSVNLGDSFPVRKADGQDLSLTVVGILAGLAFRQPPPRTVEAPSLAPDSSAVSSGVFVSLRTSEEIFGRASLTDALVIARTPDDVPALVGRLRDAFRLEPGVFVVERYSQFRRKVQDFALTLELFVVLSASTALLAGSFAANLMHDVYADRRRQYATMIALGFSPARGVAPGLALGAAVAVSTTILGGVIAISLSPRHFAMPSLLADLGGIEPRFDWRIAGVLGCLNATSVVLGMTPTVWRLFRRRIAATLLETGQ